MLVVGDWLCFFNALIEEFAPSAVSHTFDKKSAQIGYQLNGGREAWFERKGVDLETEPWPAEDGTYDLVIATEVIEHLPSDPMHFMCEANRVLRKDGVIIHSTPNGSSLQSIFHAIQGDSPVSFGVFSDGLIEHPKEYAVNEFSLLHLQSGFDLTRHETFSPYGKPDLTELRQALDSFGLQEAMAGQVQLIVAQKNGDPKCRRYAPLYLEDQAYDSKESRPNASALNHQWWGDCPFVDDSGAADSSGQWPANRYNTGDRLLLKACLLPTPDALDSYLKWRAWKSLDSLTHNELVLLAFLFHRIQDWGIEDEDRNRIKGVHRYHWARLHSINRKKDQLLAELAEEGIPSVLLKGAALNTTVYRKPELRPMNDFDFMVPAEKAPQAIQFLKDRGWSILGREPQRTSDEEYVRYLHALAFKNQHDGAILDLHWHLTMFHLRPEDDLFFLNRAVKQDGAPDGPSVLCPEDLVFHLIVHQIQYSSNPSMIWPIDVVLTIQRLPFDWGKLAEAAEHSRMAHPTYLALKWLRSEFHLDDLIPESVIQRLATPPTKDELNELEVAGSPLPSQSSFRERFPFARITYRRLSAGWPVTRKAREFHSFLKVVNFYDHDPIQQWVKNWWSLSLPVAMERMKRRFRQVSTAEGDISGFPEESLKGFYPLESHQGMIFRWTDINASLQLNLKERDATVSIHFAPFREEEEIERALSIRLNSRKIEEFTVQEGIIRFDIKQDWFASGIDQQLFLRMSEPQCFPGDSRELGLPILSVRVSGVSGV